jgi:deazaflavin-dependent oxidoreductase (nitroreductase family)
MVLVASRGGMSSHPAWYLNLLDDPRAVVEVGATKREVSGRLATAEEREEMWPALTVAYPHFDAYQERTARAIPVVVLSPHC